MRTQLRWRRKSLVKPEALSQEDVHQERAGGCDDETCNGNEIKPA
jgi:hypothetical protein